jgi:beta-glucosidase
MLRGLTGLALIALATGSLAAQQGPVLPYRDPGLPVSRRVSDLLGRMSVEEKFWQLYMAPGDLDDPGYDWSHGVFGLQVAARSADPRVHAERVNAIQLYFVERTRLGIPLIPFEEAVHGLALPGATVFPQAIALAATWDTGLVGRVARAIARETRSRGIRQVLAPVVNLASDARWGRVEETYGEDPYLASQMGSAFVAGFERNGVIATPKHFVANVGEGGRDSYPIDLSPRALEERFFPPFRSAIRSGARSVMTAYNSVDGTPATQNRWLLTEVLKQGWGFGGFVISDAAATGGAVVLHRTEPNTVSAATRAWNAGLDVVFQSSWPQHRPYLEAFRNGGLTRAVMDSAVARVLRAKFELGLFEHPYVPAESAGVGNGNPAHRELALEAARRSVVLLRNEGMLPLSRTLGSLAVIGTDATEARLGGYSGPGVRVTSILDGIRNRMGAERVRYAAGPGRGAEEVEVVPPDAFPEGLTGSYYDNPRLEGSPRLSRRDRQIDVLWTFNPPAPGIPTDWYSVRWEGTLEAPSGGVRRLGVQGNDGYRLYLDDRLVIDNWRKESWRTRLVPLDLEPGSRHRVRLEFFETRGNVRLQLVWDGGARPDWRALADSAVAITRESDFAVVVAGIEEGEFRDRARLSLPGHQEELILRVARTGKPVVVVLVGGSAITMSRWIDSVGAVVMAWYPGEAGGTALAEVLFGDFNPGGRLPITFPRAEGQLPLVYNHKPTGRGDDYLDLTGKPLFPFGFGLSYTTFSYGDLRIEPHRIRCTVRNTGDRAGEEVVQLYLRRPLASTAQPVLQLAGFQRIGLAPGQAREVIFTPDPDQFMILDSSLRRVLEPGVVRVMIGASSEDIRLRGALRVP